MKVSQGSASHENLRHYYHLKLVVVLLFPCGSILPLLVCCLVSLWALRLLRSPHISVKPSSVFLSHVVLSDGLVVLHWVLRWGAWMTSDERATEGGSLQLMVMFLNQQLLQTHHLASLLLLGLLGMEAALVLRWPQQTRRLRTSHWAQLSCGLVWILILLELVLLNSQLQSPELYSQTTPGSSLSLDASLPVFSSCLRKVLWLGNLYLHYVVPHSKPQKRRSSFY